MASRRRLTKPQGHKEVIASSIIGRYTPSPASARNERRLAIKEAKKAKRKTR